MLCRNTFPTDMLYLSKSIRKGYFVMTEIKKPTFGEWAAVWLKEYKKPNVKATTYKDSYERIVQSHLNPRFADKQICEIKPLELIQFLNEQAEVYSDTELHKRKLCLKGIFDTAVENDLCDKSPFTSSVQKIKSKIKPTAKRTYTQNQVNDILAFCDTHRTGIYIRILLELGLRCSEMCGLQWGDINFDNRTIRIQRSCVEYDGRPLVGDTKNESSKRVLPLSTKLCGELAKLKKMKRNVADDDFLLSSQKCTGQPIAPTKFNEGRFKTFFRDYGLDDYLSPHELRHTCGTLLYERSQDIYAVSKYLGHSTITITAKLYVHNNAEQLQKTLSID